MNGEWWMVKQTTDNHQSCWVVKAILTRLRWMVNQRTDRQQSCPEFKAILKQLNWMVKQSTDNHQSYWVVKAVTSVTFHRLSSDSHTWWEIQIDSGQYCFYWSHLLSPPADTTDNYSCSSTLTASLCSQIHKLSSLSHIHSLDHSTFYLFTFSITDNSSTILYYIL